MKITDSVKEILNKETGTKLQVISAEAYTKHGWNLSCCIFDELHVQPNRYLYDVMLKGSGLARRQPIWWFVTTAGDDPDRTSIAWEVHEKAVSILKATAPQRRQIQGYPHLVPGHLRVRRARTSGTRRTGKKPTRAWGPPSASKTCATWPRKRSCTRRTSACSAG